MEVIVNAGVHHVQGFQADSNSKFWNLFINSLN